MAPEDTLKDLRRELNASLDTQRRHINEVEALRKQLEHEYAQTNRRFGQLDSRLGYVDRRFVQQARAMDQLSERLLAETQRRSDLGFELRQRKSDRLFFWQRILMVVAGVLIAFHHQIQQALGM